MSHPKSEDYIVYEGEKFQVEFYFNEKGELPAKEYFESADYKTQLKLLALSNLLLRMVNYSTFPNSGKLIKSKRFMNSSLVQKDFLIFFMRTKKLLLPMPIARRGRK